MNKVEIERDHSSFCGWYIYVNNRCVAYTATRWHARRIARRYLDPITREQVTQ